MTPTPPLVSIVIPTWQRTELLLETLDHIQEQTYKNVEVIIVSDGPQSLYNLDLVNRNYSIIELGRNWSGLMPDSFGIKKVNI